ncbi:hypothetical protein PR003_g2572 [Phytophthora rubi]|uniref:Mesoderm development candidate 2 n=1 Tax=Phytophthora rubi TaxID=129364 RepID=A0A6A4G874_9STRA|nr:hypothetical protein PR002_g3385 [Phytophthora rubi]KAE9050439.1 hypothetical protein PR001_g2379 [Phytophthora rubi]KAE9355953.1 hypothetical protein PR003_g2572 [Phytophthora rubi]
MQRSLLLLLCLLLAVVPCLECGRAKTIDYDALDKAWEAGDAEEELRTEGDEHYKQLQDKNEQEAKALGPQMIFVTMKEKGGRRREPLPDVASRWKEMLWNGGVDVNIYEVADAKLLVGLQKGIFVEDVMRFLDDQHDVQEYEWNGKTYPAGRKSKKHGHHKRHKKGTNKRQRKITANGPDKDSKHNKHPHAKRQHPRLQTQITDTTKSKDMRAPSDEL